MTRRLLLAVEGDWHVLTLRRCGHRAAAVIAEGSDYAEIIAWITAHAGTPQGDRHGAAEARPPRLAAQRRRWSRATVPLRYVLPAGTVA